MLVDVAKELNIRRVYVCARDIEVIINTGLGRCKRGDVV